MKIILGCGVKANTIFWTIFCFFLFTAHFLNMNNKYPGDDIIEHFFDRIINDALSLKQYESVKKNSKIEP
jgi:hypothetical protein